MKNRLLRRLFPVCALSLSCAATAPAQVAGDARDPEAPAIASAHDPKIFEALRSSFVAQVRASFLDQTGRTPLPSADFPGISALAFAPELSELNSLAAKAAYVELGRGPEDLPAYADMVVLVAMRLDIEPPESALPIYRNRRRPKDEPLTPRQSQGFAELTDALRHPAFNRRYLYIADLVEKTAPAPASAPAAARRGRLGKRRRARPSAAAPPEPKGPPESVLDSIDWRRADELAAAAASGADGWNRRTRRRRRGRCYEWVRMALQKTGLWTDAYREKVPHQGDARRPRRAYSFAWAMNTIESRGQGDPFAGRTAPLRRLDLRIDPLLRGSIVVFDRNACGFNARSGHIEVITSIEPLRASSYKFHEVKLDCLVQAANAGRVHVYVPQRLDPYPPSPAGGPGPAGAAAP